MPYDINALLAQLEAQQKASNTAGMDRYKNLLSSVDATDTESRRLFDSAMARTGTMGQTGRADIEGNRVARQAEGAQDLIGRGLTNTTITDTTRRGINSDADRQRLALEEGVNNAKTGLLTQRAGANMDMGRLKADSILSRQDVGPDMGMYMQLLQQLAASGNGQAQGRSYNFAGGTSGGFSGAGSRGAAGDSGSAAYGGGGGSSGGGVSDVHTTYGDQGKSNISESLMGGGDPTQPSYWAKKGYPFPGMEADSYKNALARNPSYAAQMLQRK